MVTDSTSASRVPARPSSSTSELFGGLYARGGALEQVSDTGWLAAMLDVEAALARACAAEGLIDVAAAEAVVSACRVEAFDVAAIGREAAEHASPVLGLVRALREAVGPDLAGSVHLGATSQDILDTAAMLVARRALSPIVDDAEAAADAAAVLADRHRSTVISGRTLLQPAVRTSFGLKAAGWLAGIDEVLVGVLTVRDSGLAVQMGGPVGHRAPGIGERVAQELGLVAPTLPWHVNRVRPVALATSLGTLSGALAKAAQDVVLLAQGEVAEVREGGAPGRGGSSAMAHKRNPVAAVSVLACAERTPGLVTTMLGAMAHEHERAAGRWQAEWGALTELLRLTGSAAAWSRDLLGGLEPDPERMRANAAGLDGDLGAAEALVDRALAAHRRRPR